jgi:predicted outer membrane repeat protein
LSGLGDDRAVRHVVTGSDDARLDGFTITKGNAAQEHWLQRHQMGGGMLNWEVSPIVANCVFDENRSNLGGGAISQYKGELRIYNTVFENNISNYNGGAVFISEGVLYVEDCQFVGNYANYFGGAIFSEFASTTIIGSRFLENECLQAGGALAIRGGDFQIENCKFEKNIVSFIGGAAVLYGTDGTVEKCEFVDNRGLYGGALVLTFGGTYSIEDSTFSGNSAALFGGALLIRDYVVSTVQNCTFYHNTAGDSGGSISTAFTLGDVPKVANSIMWGSTPTEVSTEYEGTINIVYSNVQNGYEGEGNTDRDPLFEDPESGNYKLSPESPCIDAAHGEFASERDFNDNPRVDVPGIDNTGNGTPNYADMGAFELQP